MSGLAGADLISGGLGNDLLLGGDGNDFPSLDKGLDTAVGGAGTDAFLLALSPGRKTANGNTTIQADVDGTANGLNFVDMVVLQGVSTDLAGLPTSGNLIV